MKKCRTGGCINTASKQGIKPDGMQRYGARCKPCRKVMSERVPFYHIFKKSYCEVCGFVAEDLCQLDVDHINQDRSDASGENLRTVCANCHRLITKRHGY